MIPVATLVDKYLAHTNRVCWRPGLEGQVVQGEVIYIGERAGPELKSSNLAHEMSHLVEIDDKRMLLYGWGLKVRRVWVYDRFCYEPNTREATERELRVIAYQTNLLESFGVTTDSYDFVRSLTSMSDFIHIPLEDGRSAFGDDAPSREEVPDKDASRVRWMMNRVKDLRAEYTLERFNREWDRKLDLLSRVNFLELGALLDT